MSTTGLFIDTDGMLADDAAALTSGAAAVIKRMNLAGVPVVVIGAQPLNPEQPNVPAMADLIRAEVPDAELAAEIRYDLADPKRAFPRPTLVLEAAHDLGIDLTTSWLVAASYAAVKAAEQAGCYGAVLVGDGPDPEGFLSIRLKRARDLSDAPRVMVPDDGGCWHDHG